MRFLSSTVLPFAFMGSLLNAAPRPSDDFVFGQEIEIGTSISYGMHQPPTREEALRQLRKNSEAQAKKLCNGVFDGYDQLFKTKEGQLSESILSFNLDSKFFCGKKVFHASEVVGPLTRALSEYYIASNNDGPNVDLDFAYSLHEVAIQMLAAVGPTAEPALMELFNDELFGPDAQGDVIQIMRQAMIQNNFDEFFESLLKLGLSNEGYVSDLAFANMAQYYNAAYLLPFKKQSIIAEYGEQKYLNALLAVSRTNRVGSRLAISVDHYLSFLENIWNTQVIADALLARGLAANEVESVNKAFASTILKFRELPGAEVQKVMQSVANLYFRNATRENGLFAIMMKESMFIILTKEDLAKYQSFYYGITLGFGNLEDSTSAPLLELMREANGSGMLAHSFEVIADNATDDNLKAWGKYLRSKL